ncbi:MAG: hypothetical protein KDE31_06045, partial [Caldilineaceae bacterium]|nr:hypothetical protein [Caldilineaceae bacterium]
WRMRVQQLEDRPTAPFHYTVYRLGDAFWVTTGGEPYSVIQSELRRRFPHHPILFSPLAHDFQVAYLLPSDRYGRGLYQEEPSILAQGCLEILIEAIAERIMELLWCALPSSPTSTATCLHLKPPWQIYVNTLPIFS